MKKRILLSLVAFFAMTAMWASLNQGAFKIYVTGANGKTNNPATLKLNMANKNAVGMWECTVVLPDGVTYVPGSVTITPGRYPEGAPTNVTETVNADGSVTFVYAVDEDEDGKPDFVLTGSDGEIASFSVNIAGTATVGENIVTVKEGAKMFEGNGTARNNDVAEEFKWTIEEGQASLKGDVNKDGSVDLSDALTILDKMAEGSTDVAFDVDGDGNVNLSDFLSILDIMAEQ